MDKNAAKKDRRPLRLCIRMALKGRAASPLLYAALLSAAACARLYSSMRLSRQIGRLGAALARRRFGAELARVQLDFALWALPAAASSALVCLARDRFALALRSNLHAAVTEAYTTSPDGAAGSALRRVAQPAARATDDVRELSEQLGDLYLGVFKPVVEVVALTASLSSMMGARNVAKCYGMFLLLGGWSRWVAPSFATLAGDVAQREADLRASHTRVVEYADEIEALRGRAVETRDLQASFLRLRDVVARRQLHTSLSSGLDTYVVRHMGTLAAFAAMVPAVATAQTDGSAAHKALDPTEYFLTCLHLLVNVGIACRDLMLNFRRLATCSALSGRVCELIDELQAGDAAGAPLFDAPHVAADGFRLDAVSVAASSHASQTVILRDVSVSIPQHCSVLVQGANGAGKSRCANACVAACWCFCLPPASLEVC